MRKIAVIVNIVLVQVAFGQEWAKVGTKWYVTHSIEMASPPGRGYALLQSVKDTVVNDTLAYKISVTRYPHFYPSDTAKNRLGVAINFSKQSFAGSNFVVAKLSGKYFYKRMTDKNWILMYDSAWQIGKEYTMYNKSFEKLLNVSVVDTGTTIINGKSFKQKVLKINTEGYAYSTYTCVDRSQCTVKFIENVGFEFGGIYPFISDLAIADVIPDYANLRCIEMNGIKYVFSDVACDSMALIPFTHLTTSDKMPNNSRIYVQNGIITIKSDREKIINIELYNFQGQQLYSKSNIHLVEYNFNLLANANQNLVIKVLFSDNSITTNQLQYEINR